MWKRVLLTCLKYNDWKADNSCFISWTESHQALWCPLGQSWELPSLEIIPSPSLSSQRFKCLVLTHLLPFRDLFMLSDVDLLFYPLLCLPLYNSFSENCAAHPHTHTQKNNLKIEPQNDTAVYFWVLVWSEHQYYIKEISAPIIASFLTNINMWKQPKFLWRGEWMKKI